LSLVFKGLLEVKLNILRALAERKIDLFFPPTTKSTTKKPTTKDVFESSEEDDDNHDVNIPSGKPISQKEDKVTTAKPPVGMIDVKDDGGSSENEVDTGASVESLGESSAELESIGSVSGGAEVSVPNVTPEKEYLPPTEPSVQPTPETGYLPPV
jgi:hypothetical protein